MDNSVYDKDNKKCTNIRCDICEWYRWDDEYEYEYCMLDPLERRIPVCQPL